MILPSKFKKKKKKLLKLQKTQKGYTLFFSLKFFKTKTKKQIEILKTQLRNSKHKQKMEIKQCKVNTGQCWGAFSLLPNGPFYRERLGLWLNENITKFDFDLGEKMSIQISYNFLSHRLLCTSSLSCNPFTQLLLWLDFLSLKLIWLDLHPF